MTAAPVRLAGTAALGAGLIMASAAWYLRHPLPVHGAQLRRYAGPGPHRVTVFDAVAGDRVHRVYLPDGDAAHPLVVWGNGSGAWPRRYERLCQRIAGWGFVVVSPYSTDTGTGLPLVEAARFALDANRRTGELRGQVDGSRIGFAGHSQGAAGAINAHTAWDESPAQAVVTLSLPDPRHFSPEDRIDRSRIDAPLLIVNGSHDPYISSRHENLAWLRSVREGRPAALAYARAASHLEAHDTGGTYLPPLVAWMRTHLHADAEAARVFVPDGDLLTHPRWRGSFCRNDSQPRP